MLRNLTTFQEQVQNASLIGFRKKCRRACMCTHWLETHLEAEWSEDIGILNKRVVDLWECFRGCLGSIVDDVSRSIKVKSALLDRIRKVNLLKVSSLSSQTTKETSPRQQVFSAPGTTHRQ